MPDQLGELGGDEDDAVARGGQLLHEPVDLLLALDVDAVRGLVEDEDVAPDWSHLASTTFCWLPPEGRTGARAGRP